MNKRPKDRKGDVKPYSIVNNLDVYVANPKKFTKQQSKMTDELSKLQDTRLIYKSQF